MKQQSKLSSEQQQQHATQNQTEQQAREFASAEELLRFDAGQTAVPPGILQRLAKSAAEIPAPNRPWWKKLFGS